MNDALVNMLCSINFWIKVLPMEFKSGYLVRVLQIFTAYWRDKGLAELVVATSFKPPMRLPIFKAMLGVTPESEFQRILKAMCSEGLITLIDEWVYPGHRTVEALNKIISAIKNAYSIKLKQAID